MGEELASNRGLAGVQARHRGSVGGLGMTASTKTLSSVSAQVSVLLLTCHLLSSCSGLTPGLMQTECLSLASSPSSLGGEVNYFTQSPCYTQPRRFDDFPPLESVELKFISEPSSILHRLGNTGLRHPAPPPG